MDNALKIAFEPFVKLSDVKKPFKLIPEGIWYRGKRKLEITASRLEEAARNFSEGLPRFRVPINLDHADHGGKVGDVKQVAFMKDGPDGSGLYITEYELTEKGQKAIEEDGYDAVSAEIVWSLAGAKFQDPETGDYHDNVLVGMALTPKPFFGHEQVSLYSAEPYDMSSLPTEQRWMPHGGAKTFSEYDAHREAQKEAGRLKETDYIFRDLLDNIWYADEMELDDKAMAIKQLVDEFKSRVSSGGEKEGYSVLDKIKELLGGKDEPEEFRSFTAEQRKQLAEEGKAMPDGGYPIVTKGDLQNAISAFGRGKGKAQVKAHIKKRAKALGADDLIPENWEAVIVSEEILAESETQEETMADEQKVEQMAAELKVANEKAEELTAQLRAVEAEKRAVRLTAKAESFKALGIEKDEFIEKFGALEAEKPELAEWVIAKFEAFDKSLVEAGTLREIGSDAPGEEDPKARFHQLVANTLTEKFDGKQESYTAALQLVSAAHPELARAYLG